jgi:uncharacterized membrane protein YkoI
MANSMTLSRRLALALLGAWLFASPAGFANHGHDKGKVPDNTRGEAALGPDQAAALVRARTGGRVLGVRAVQRGDRLYYRVKVLKSGFVRIYRVDAGSGAVID